MNPAEKGIPNGGNWKSVGIYDGDAAASASQLAAPWATHFKVNERFPETHRSEKEQMLKTRYDEIKAQLAEVEGELDQRRREKEEINKAKRNRVMPRTARDALNNKKKALGRNPKTTFKGTKKKNAPRVGGGAKRKPDFSVSKSARAYLDNL